MVITALLAIATPTETWTPSTPLLRRSAKGMVLAITLLGAAGYLAQPAPAYAGYANCVNVVLRDGYWAQHRRIVQAGGNAHGIGGAFARHGFMVNNKPSPGAIMVWPAGYAGASGLGHVGVVAAVYDNGATVLVRHENWPLGSSEHAQVFAVRPGYQFVHRTMALAGGVAQPVPPQRALRIVDASPLDEEPAPLPEESAGSEPEYNVRAAEVALERGRWEYADYLEY